VSFDRQSAERQSEADRAPVAAPVAGARGVLLEYPWTEALWNGRSVVLDLEPRAQTVRRGDETYLGVSL
jgi:hypothetical protein